MTKNPKKIILVAAILYAFFLTSLYTATFQPLHSDEMIMIPAGPVYLQTGEFGFNPTHPPLASYITGTSLLVVDLEMPYDTEAWEKLSVLPFWDEFKEANQHQMNDVVFYARLPWVLLATVLGFGVFYLTRMFFGFKLSILALLIYALNPIVMEYSAYALTDMGVAFFVFFSVFFFALYHKKGSRRHLLLSVVLTGLAISTKVTAVFLIPLFIVLLIRKDPGYSLLYVTVPFLILFASYGFQLNTINDIITSGAIETDSSLIDFALNGIKLPFLWLVKGLLIQFNKPMVFSLRYLLPLYPFIGMGLAWVFMWRDSAKPDVKVAYK